MKEPLLTNNPLKLERYYNLIGRYYSPYSLISINPLIFCLQFGYELEGFNRSFHFLFESLKDKRAYFLCFTTGYLEGTKIIPRIKNLEESYKRQYPRFSFIHLCTTERQQKLFAAQNIRAIFCNHNSMVDENIFRPLPEVEKKYDAVYDGSLAAVKRHYLAAEIESLALIFYYRSFKAEDIHLSETIKKPIQHAHFFNNREPQEYRKLTPAEVNQCLNECRVGLCLSEEEGAMYASIQYLLAGLPVVTTPSRGGRDEFFESDYVLTVEPNSEAVTRGVKEAMERKIPTSEIRAGTLAKMAEHRGRFIELGAEIYAAENCGRSFADDFKKAFFNKLHKNQSHLKILEIIEKGNVY